MNSFDNCDTNEEARYLFNSKIEVIRKGWKKRDRNRGKVHKFEETPEHWRTRRIYRLIKTFLESGYRKILMKIIVDRKIRYEGPYDIREQPFKLGMLIFFSDNPTVISPQRRYDLGNAMEYAYRHKVSPRHLNGFIKQAGLKKIREKLSTNHTEPGFKNKK